MNKHSLTRLIGKFSFLIPLLFLTVLSSCGSDDGGGGGGAVDNRPRPSVIYMWRTSNSVSLDGDIGGVSGADNECDMDNSSQTFTTSVSTHRAVIVSSTFDPRNIFANDPPVQRPNGTVITDSYSDFFDNSITSRNSIGSAWTYWTGLNSNGVVSSNTCNDWTTDASGSDGNTGSAGARNVSRFNNSAISCNNTYALLCISY